MNGSQEILNRIHVGSTFFSSDEPHFHLSATVNKQNFRYWSENNPWKIHERPLHSLKVTVWCAISKFEMVGLYFFKENGQTLTANAQRYISMLDKFFESQLEELMGEIYMETSGSKRTGLWHILLEFQWQICDKCFLYISFLWGVTWDGPRIWAFVIFFLWATYGTHGYIKEKVFKHRSQILEKL